MATCKFCRREVIQTNYGETTLILDPHYKAYAPVAEHHTWAEDGDKVFLTTGLVEHWVVCVKQRDAQGKAQATYRAQHPEKGVPR